MPGSLLDETRMVFLEVTNHCNFRCSFCPQGISKRPPQHMDMNLTMSILDQLQEAGYEHNLYFHLLGEPLLHPNIHHIVASAAKKLPRTILFTNGSLLTDRAIKSIFSAGPYELMISMQLLGHEVFRERGSRIGWSQYASRIRKTVEYKLSRNACTLLRISAGIKKTDTIHPEAEYFPDVSPEKVSLSLLELFSTIPGLDHPRLQTLLGPESIATEARFEVAPGVSVSIKKMGNWRSIYEDTPVEKGYCPWVGKELGILSNGEIVLCHLDYDGRTSYANVKDGDLVELLSNPDLLDRIHRFSSEGYAPHGCRYCAVARKKRRRT